jgi:glycosyltransferase involved in cell wall biosynthesis
MAASVYVVIPAYQEAATIGLIVGQCRMLAEVSRVVVIDDGSRDETAAIAAENGATVLRHSRNLGKGASLMRGMLAAVQAGASHVVTLDGDCQHRPEDLPRLLECGRQWPGHIIVGSRRANGHDAPRGRFIANRVADFWISWAAGHPIEDSQSGFRVYPADFVQRLGMHPPKTAGFAFESEILIEAARLGFFTVAVDIPAVYGEVLRRESHFRPLIDITKIVLMVASKLLRAGMHPIGLWRSLTRQRLRCSE